MQMSTNGELSTDYPASVRLFPNLHGPWDLSISIIGAVSPVTIHRPKSQELSWFLSFPYIPISKFYWLYLQNIPYCLRWPSLPSRCCHPSPSHSLNGHCISSLVPYVHAPCGRVILNGKSDNFTPENCTGNKLCTLLTRLHTIWSLFTSPLWLCSLPIMF